MFARGIEWLAWCPQRGNEDADEMADAAREAHIKVIEMSQGAFKALSDTPTPQGIAAVMRIEPVALADLVVEKWTTLLVLHDLRDPGNVGTMIRSADAFGANGIILTGSCVDPYDPKVVRSTAGSLFHLPVVEADWSQVVSWAGDRSVKLYATDVDGQHTVGAVGIPRRVAFVVGNEAHGLPDEVLQQVDYTVRIPLPGRAESLNAGVAAGVVLYEADRQKREQQSA